MTDTRGSERQAQDGNGDASGGSGTQGLLDRNPGANHLAEEFGSYFQARLDKALGGVGDRIGDVAEKVGEAHLGPGTLLRGVGKGVGHMASEAKDSIMDKVTSGKSGKSSSSNSGGKNLTIIEDVDVGVPVEEAYNQWTQFQEFSRFAKGVVSVEQKDETTTRWQVKVAKSNRAWTGNVTEQIPDERIAWSSEGAKGTTRGVVTFHPLGENLTKVLLVMEYYPKGFFEKTGSLVRAQGRRVRLDLKAFRTFVMLKGEATGSWRGEIRDGEVVAGPDEEQEEGEEGQAQDEYEDDGYEDEDEDDELGPEDRDEEDEEDDDEGEPEDRYDEDDELDEDEDEEEAEDRYDDEPEEADEDDEDEDEEPRAARRSRKR
ncbi:SRPBCC family protein [Streptomyces sp. NPDC048018]|uniref:SRPBCC family protein n=1 Tax=Streptomyces sp. NPDC048018 TaxID=3365499 RepID=UPI00371DD341